MIKINTYKWFKPMGVILGLGFATLSQPSLANNNNSEAPFCADYNGFKNANNITCGTIQVPENHEDPTGRQITLAYLIVKAKNGNSDNYPIIYFDGGPGGSALSKSSVSFFSNSPMSEFNDLIMFDQRGIGHSSALPNVSPSFYKIQAQDIAGEDEQKHVQKALDEYKEKSHELGISLEHYNSFQSADDIGVLMKQLGYGKYNLFGISYGTELGRVIQDKFPELLHSAVHSGPGYMDDFLLGRFSAYSVGIQRLLDFCEKDATCKKTNPDLKKSYFSVFKALKKKPISVPVGDGEFIVNPQDAIYMIRKALYADSARTLVPELINDLIRGKGKALNIAAARASSLLTTLHNYSMTLSVERYETFDVNNTAEVIEKAYEDYPLIPAKFGLFDAFYQAGMSWHNKSQTAANKEFKMTDIPSLVMVNFYDPATPPENGVHFIKKMTQGKLLVLDEWGHFGGGLMCQMGVMRNFLNKPNSDLDTSCLKLYDYQYEK